jgi:hypothetical protein
VGGEPAGLGLDVGMVVINNYFRGMLGTPYRFLA